MRLLDRAERVEQLPLDRHRVGPRAQSQIDVQVAGCGDERRLVGPAALDRADRALWRDEAGFVVSTELVLIATIVVIGLIAGLTTVRDAVVTELADVADAISEVDQSYSYGGISAHCARTAGTTFLDGSDFCEVPGAQNDQNPQGGAQCVVLCLPGGGGNENSGSTAP